VKSEIRRDEREIDAGGFSNRLEVKNHRLEVENQRLEVENQVQTAQYGALQPLLDDPEIEEIWINSPQRIFVARQGQSELTNIVLTASQLQAIMDRILMWCGRRIDLSHPFVDARLPDACTSRSQRLQLNIGR
jgi:Flp pilus assembly CpaF family ATPase